MVMASADIWLAMCKMQSLSNFNCECVGVNEKNTVFLITTKLRIFSILKNL